MKYDNTSIIKTMDIKKGTVNWSIKYVLKLKVILLNICLNWCVKELMDFVV